MIKINIKNLGEDLVNIADIDFYVEESIDLISWKELEVYTSKEYYIKERNEYIAGAVIMVLGAAANAASAGYGSSTTSGTVYGNTRYGSYSGSYSSRTSYYDPVAAELSNQRYSQMVSSYASTGKGWLEFLENNLFYSTTLSPGEEYFGLVFSRRGIGKYYRITFAGKEYDVVSITYIKETM